MTARFGGAEAAWRFRHAAGEVQHILSLAQHFTKWKVAGNA